MFRSEMKRVGYQMWTINLRIRDEDRSNFQIVLADRGVSLSRWLRNKMLKEVNRHNERIKEVVREVERQDDYIPDTTPDKTPQEPSNDCA